jgi:site-specific DNA-cytosine methylase
MRVLVACEYSGVVRDAFLAAGHDAVSCDLLPTDSPGPHYQGDVFDVLGNWRNWDLLIAHPPCTHLAVSGARHFAAKRDIGVQQEALEFVRRLLDAPIERIALENPISIISSQIRKPDQIVQPWQFGHAETKATCLWLKNLPKLVPTDDVYDHMMTLPKAERNRVHYMSPGPDRWKLRSTTYAGFAAAMAAQWGAPDLLSVVA